jgi:HK97 family phage portal protein
MWTRDMLYSREKPLLLSAVYRCVDLISDSLAVMPLKTYHRDAQGFKTEAEDHPLYSLLDLEPNEDMTRYTFNKTMMVSALLKGNAYAYIERNPKGVVEQLIYIPANEVTIEFIKDHNGISRKRYRVNGFKKLVEPRDMIHVMNFSHNGIVGVSTLTHAAQTLGITTSAEEHTSAFFDGGGNVSGVLTVEGRLKKEQKDAIYETWAERMGTLSVRRSPIAVLEGNMKYQPITISPKDATLIQTREFQVIDICRFFGVSPVKAFDLSKSSYSTVEATQLQYLVDTVLPILTKFEQEINRKVILPRERRSLVVEFDTSVLLRTDKAAEAAYMRDMTYIGAITPNEVRRRMNLAPLENGNTAFVQVNMQPLDHAVNAPIETPNQQSNIIENE